MKMDLAKQMKKAHEFKGIATALAETVMLQGTETDDEVEHVTFFVSTVMAIGARAKRNEHIMIGVGIGSVATALVCNVINKKKEEKLDEELEETVIMTMEAMDSKEE